MLDSDAYIMNIDLSAAAVIAAEARQAAPEPDVLVARCAPSLTL